MKSQLRHLWISGLIALLACTATAPPQSPHDAAPGPFLWEIEGPGQPVYLFGTIHLALEALQQARVAKRVIAERGETPHLKGKALNLRFFVANLLPQSIALAKAIQSSDDSCLDESLFV